MNLFSDYSAACSGIHANALKSIVNTDSVSGHVIQDAIQSMAFGNDIEVTVKRKLHIEIVRRRGAEKYRQKPTKTDIVNIPLSFHPLLPPHFLIKQRSLQGICLDFGFHPLLPPHFWTKQRSLQGISPA